MYIDLFRFSLFECFELTHDPLELPPYFRDLNLFIRITLSSRLDYDISKVLIGVDTSANLPKVILDYPFIELTEQLLLLSLLIHQGFLIVLRVGDIKWKVSFDRDLFEDLSETFKKFGSVMCLFVIFRNPREIELIKGVGKREVAKEFKESRYYIE